MAEDADLGAGDRGRRRRRRRRGRARRRRRRRGATRRAAARTSRSGCRSPTATSRPGWPRADAVVSGRFRTQLDPPGLHRAAVVPRLDRARRDARRDTRAPQGAFMVRQGLCEMLGLPTDTVRVQAAPIGGAFGGKLMISEPLAAAAALEARPAGAARLPALARTSPPANPAPGQLIDLELGATRDGELTAIRGRIVGDRGGAGRDGRRDHLDDALRRAVPLGRARPDRGRRGHQPRQRRRLPRARRAAGRVRGRVADGPRWRAKLGLDPIELPAAERARRRRRGHRRAGDQGLRRARVPRARARAPAVRRAATTLPEDEGVGVALGFWPGGLEPAAAICKLDADGKLTVVTAAADMSGIENAFVAIAAETFGLAEDSVRVTTGDTASAPYGGVAGGSKVTYTYGRAIERAAAEARERLLRRRRRASSRSRPRTSSSSTARCARSARPAAASRSPTSRPRRTRSAARTSRSRATAASRRSAARPAPPCTSRHVRVDRETGGVTRARPRDRAGRRQGAQPGARRGPDARRHRAGHRLGAARGAQPRRGRPAAGRLRSPSTRCRRTDQVPPIETLIVEVPAPDGPFGAKGVGEPPVVRRPRRDRQRDRRGHRRPHARAADDADAGMERAQTGA